MVQLTPLPLTVSCFSEIQIGFTFLVSAHPDSPRQRAVKHARVCVCCGCLSVLNSRINILQFACGITSHQAVLYADCGSGCDTSQRSSLLLLRCWSGITGKPFLRCSTNGSMTCLHLTDQQTLLPVDRHNRFSVHFKWIP